MARPPGSSNLAISDLQRMLDQRKAELGRLLKQRTALQRELDALDRRIAKLEGAGGGGRRGGGGRARNAASLTEVLRTVLRDSGKPMKVGDLEAAVLATGYRSTSANFRGIINQALIKDDGFGQVERGVYELRESKGGGSSGGGGRGKGRKGKSAAASSAEAA